MFMDITPPIKLATERKTEVKVMAKPVWRKSVLNYRFLLILVSS